jgi:hypothetical protein
MPPSFNQYPRYYDIPIKGRQTEFFLNFENIVYADIPNNQKYGVGKRRFVGAVEALEIAISANQPIKRIEGYAYLVPEDLW